MRLAKVLLLLAVAGNPQAHAAPTPEEQALQAHLSGRAGEAVRVLDNSGDAQLRWLAGRYAVDAGEFGAARRLLARGELASDWGRVSLLVAQNQRTEAAKQALALMDAALTGGNREALTRMLQDWAGERAIIDSQLSNSLLWATLELAPTTALRHGVEDRLLDLPKGSAGGTIAELAQDRLDQQPGHLAARNRFAQPQGGVYPAWTLDQLRPVVAGAPRTQALEAAETLSTLALPDPLILAELQTLHRRFVGDTDVSALRLRFATALIKRDERAGSAALAALEEDPTVGVTALETRAAATSDPRARRALWQKLAAREGASSRGEKARVAARDALLTSVNAQPAGVARVLDARDALAEVDGHDHAQLLYASLADGAGRTEALWSQVERFPKGEPWCEELATALVEAGADDALASRWSRACGEGGSVDAQALSDQVRGQANLSLRPRPGHVEARVSASSVLRVQQHRVDPETLFFATTGNPLDAALDAYLVAPDAQWELALQADRVAKVQISPRGGGPLVAITARAGDRRATALVVAQPLDVQLIRQGKDVAVGVLRGDAPVAGAEIWLVDEQGTVVRGRTDKGGVLRTQTEPSALRVMARKGTGLGYATAGEAAPAPEAQKPVYALVPWDRAIPVSGAEIDVEIFGTLPTGGAAGPLRLRSLVDEALVEEVPVTLTNGVAHARLWATGSGALRLVDANGELLAERFLQGLDPRPGALAITWSELSPSPGGTLEATVFPLRSLPPGGIDAAFELSSPWHEDRRDLLFGPDGLHERLDLGAAAPGQRVELRLGLADREGRMDTTVASISVAVPGAPQAVHLPGWVALDEPLVGLAPAHSWLRARQGTRQIWARAEEALTLPSPGLWRVCAWDAVCGPESTVLVGEKRLDADGRWAGPPALVAVLTEGIANAAILRRGDRLPGAPRAGLSLAWASVWDGEGAVQIPLPAPPTPRIEVEGTLRRGSRSTLVLGEKLPAQSQIWAFLRDASDVGPPEAPTPVASLWDALPGSLSDLWRASDRLAEAIARALLDEEARRAEGGPLQKLDYNAIMGERGGGFGGGGSAMGAGGLGSRGSGLGGGGRSSRDAAFGRSGHPLSWDPRALAVANGARPGAWTVDVPGWVSSADLQLVARLPDGRWSSRQLRLNVGGPAPVAMPAPAPPDLAQRWDGEVSSLLPLALSLPRAVQGPALAALVQAGVARADAPLQVALATEADVEVAELLTNRMLGRKVEMSTAGVGESLPDVRRIERAEAALRLASADPERAVTMARRLLAEADLPVWIRVRAGLALWIAQDAGAVASLAGETADLGAARAQASGRSEPRFAQRWWTTARSEAAAPLDRALAIAALSQLPGTPVAALAEQAAPSTLVLSVEPPIASRRGQGYARGASNRTRGRDPSLGVGAELPLGRMSSAWLDVPASASPTRLRCPDGDGITALQAWIDLNPYPETRTMRCDFVGQTVRATTLHAVWYDASGEALAEGSAPLAVVEARDSAPGDPMSPRERLGLGLSLAEEGDAVGMGMLADLLAHEVLPADAMVQVYQAQLRGALLAGDPAGLVAAVDAYREHVPKGDLDLETAAAFAHAAAQVGQPDRAIAATSMVMDARFKEELSAVSAVRSAGLELTALKLLRTLLDRYPEVPTVIAARYLAPSMLLERANGEGDRLGYTRASLRHTAVAELAAFLLLHGDAPQAPEAASLLLGALEQLVDPGRSALLAGPLRRAYQTSPQGWLLALSDARAQLASGRPKAALDVLVSVEAPESGEGAVLLARGSAFEAMGRLEEAKAAYDRSELPEAAARAAWLVRSDLRLPPVIVLRPGDPSTLDAGMRPGVAGTLTTTRIALEDALLARDGRLDPETLAVSGLGAPEPRRFVANTAGELPLPALANGAWLLEVQSGDLRARAVLIRTDASLVVSGSGTGASFAHLADAQGEPLAGASLWLFDASGYPTAARTDAGGASWVPMEASSALARAGDRYAWWQESERDASRSAPSRAPAPAAGYGEALKSAAEGYNELFRQQKAQKVTAAGL